MDGEARLKALLSLYHYYAHAEVMRFEFHRYELKEARQQSVDTPFPAPPDPKEAGPSAFSLYWFAALWPLVEGWGQLGLRDNDIDSHLKAAGHVSDLRRFRNVVYHFQPDWSHDARVLAFNNNKELVRWAMNLSNAFRAFFARANDKESAVWEWVDGSSQ